MKIRAIVTTLLFFFVLSVNGYASGIGGGSSNVSSKPGQTWFGSQAAVDGYNKANNTHLTLDSVSGPDTQGYRVTVRTKEGVVVRFSDNNPGFADFTYRSTRYLSGKAFFYFEDKLIDCNDIRSINISRIPTEVIRPVIHSGSFITNGLAIFKQFINDNISLVSSFVDITTGTGDYVFSLMGMTPGVSPTEFIKENGYIVTVEPIFWYRPTNYPVTQKRDIFAYGTLYGLARDYVGYVGNQSTAESWVGGDAKLIFDAIFQGFFADEEFVRQTKFDGYIKGTTQTEANTARVFASLLDKSKIPKGFCTHLYFYGEATKSGGEPVSLTAFFQTSSGIPIQNTAVSDLPQLAYHKNNIQKDFDPLKIENIDKIKGDQIHTITGDSKAIDVVKTSNKAELPGNGEFKAERVAVGYGVDSLPTGWTNETKFNDLFKNTVNAQVAPYEAFTQHAKPQGVLKMYQNDKPIVQVAVLYTPTAPPVREIKYYTREVEGGSPPYTTVRTSAETAQKISDLDTNMNAVAQDFNTANRIVTIDGKQYQLKEYAYVAGNTTGLKVPVGTGRQFLTTAQHFGAEKSVTADLNNAISNIEKAQKAAQPGGFTYVLLRYEKLPEPPVPPQGRFGITVQLPNPNPKSIPTGTTSEPAQFKIEMDQTTPSDKASDIEEWQTWIAEVKNHAKALSKTAAFKIKIDITETATNLTPNTSAPTSSFPYSVTDSLERGITSTNLLDLLKDPNGTLFNYTATFDTSKHSYSLKAAATVSILAYYDGSDGSSTLMSQVDLTPDPGEATARWTTPDPNDKYSFTSIPHGNAFSEIKQGNIGNETFEAMAGTPTTQNLYFASGGDQFVVQVKMRPMTGYAVQNFSIRFTAPDPHYSDDGCCRDEEGNCTSRPSCGHVDDTHCVCGNKWYNNNAVWSHFTNKFSYMRIDDVKIWRLENSALSNSQRLTDTNFFTAQVSDDTSNIGEFGVKMADQGRTTLGAIPTTGADKDNNYYASTAHTQANAGRVYYWSDKALEKGISLNLDNIYIKLETDTYGNYSAKMTDSSMSYDQDLNAAFGKDWKASRTYTTDGAVNSKNSNTQVKGAAGAENQETFQEIIDAIGDIKVKAVSDYLILTSNAGTQRIFYFDDSPTNTLKLAPTSDFEELNENYSGANNKIGASSDKLTYKFTPRTGDYMWGYENSAGHQNVGKDVPYNEIHMDHVGYNGDATNPTVKYQPRENPKLDIDLTNANPTDVGANETVLSNPYYNKWGIGGQYYSSGYFSSPTLSGVFKLYDNNISSLDKDLRHEIPVNDFTKQNGEYYTGESEIFYKLVLDQSHNTTKYDDDPINGTKRDPEYTYSPGSTTPVSAPTHTTVNAYGAEGFIVPSVYYPGAQRINNVVIHNPVSVQDAVVNSVKEERDQRITADDRDTVPFVQLDFPFTITVPNIGDFEDSGGYGRTTTTSHEGKGYFDNMEVDLLFGNDGFDKQHTGYDSPIISANDYTAWTKSKYVTFPFNVLTFTDATSENPYRGRGNTNWESDYEGAEPYYNEDGSLKKNPVKVWLAGEPIPLFVTDTVFDFYLPLANTEAKDADVIFTSYAINNQDEDTDDYGLSLNNERYNGKTAGHSTIKHFAVDVVGRIGALTLEDTGDFRFAELLKKKATPERWRVAGLVHEVDPTQQNNIVADFLDVRGFVYSHPKSANKLDIYSNRPERNQEPIAFPLTPAKNNIEQYQTQALRLGYSLYCDIETLGNYYGENGQVTSIRPRYYAYNTKTGEYQPVDVYMSVGGVYRSVNKFDGSTPAAPYRQYLNWVTEAARRNYTGDEVTISKQVQARYHVELPRDLAYGFGTTQGFELKDRNRTFIGTSTTNGVEMNKGEGSYLEGPLDSILFGRQGQRWHFTLVLPSSSQFVRAGAAYSKDTANKPFGNVDPKDIFIIGTLDIQAKGGVWALNYANTTADTMTLTLSLPSIPAPPYPSGDPVKPIPVAVFPLDQSSINDINVVGTH
jgi:hypothetical protein